MRDRPLELTILFLVVSLHVGCRSSEKSATTGTGAEGSGTGSEGAASGKTESVEPHIDFVDPLPLRPNHLYPGARPPLPATRLSPLPSGSIRARGWLLTQLELEAGVARVQVAEVGAWLKERQPWRSADAPTWSRVTRYLGALASLAFTLDDDGLVSRVRSLLLQVIDSQDADGWIGPPATRAAFAWDSNLPLLEALRYWFVRDGDARVIEALRRYVAYQTMRLDVQGRGDPSDASVRRTLEMVHWLYNQTGDASLLKLVTTFVPEDDAAESPRESLLARVHRLTDLDAADRFESVVFNDMAASYSPGLDRRLCLPVANRVRPESTAHLSAPYGLASGDPESVGEACQALPAGPGSWSEYTLALWAAAPGDGLAAISLAPCELNARVGEDEGTAVRIEVKTHYPFEEGVELTLHAPRPVRFPLALRIPGWARGARVSVNEGRSWPVLAGQFVGLLREWREGDRVAIDLPMRLSVSSGSRNAIVIERGPLRFALHLEREAAEWNLALLADRIRPERSFQIESRPMPAQPFDPQTTPVRVRAVGRPLPSWRLDNAEMGPHPPESRHGGLSRAREARADPHSLRRRIRTSPSSPGPPSASKKGLRPLFWRG